MITLSQSIRKCADRHECLRLSNEKYRLRQYFALYTVVFALVCGIVFSWYFLTGRTFIWNSDGWLQHYKALVYYAKYMRSFIQDLLHHRFVLPEWDFSFGEGNDILQTLHYYVIGDPFAVFSVFVPIRFLWIYYDAMILLRLYLSGIAFSCLCFYTRKNVGRYAVLAGALSYVFCYWAILNANRHPYFLNPLLYFPLILLGIEKILRKEKPYLLIISVFLSAISNFYFFYVIVLMTVAYVAVRLIGNLRSDWRATLAVLLRIALASLLGTIMSGVILLPVLFAFLNDARLGSGNAWHFIYPLSYYSKLLGAFFSGQGDHWLCLGYAAPVILAISLLFMRRKQYRFLKNCFLVCTVIILIPAPGQLLNGMSYMSNKWVWAFALLCAYTFTVMWPELMDLKWRDAVKLGIVLSACFFGMLMLEYSRTLEAFACLGIAFIFLFVCFPFRMESTEQMAWWKKRKQAVALLLVIAAVANVSFFKNASATGNYAMGAKDAGDVTNGLLMTETEAVKAVADLEGIDQFYRYSGRDLTSNGNILSGLSTTQYYWTLTNPYIAECMKAYELPETIVHTHKGYDDRASLLALSSVLYYVVPSNNYANLPYGFTYVAEFNVKEDITENAKECLLKELGVEELSAAQIKVIEDATSSNYIIFRNDNALPIAYTYDTVIPESTWEGLSCVEKQEAMLQAALLTDYDGEMKKDGIVYSSSSLDYNMTYNGTGVTLEDDGFVVTTENSSVTLTFEGLENCETYFRITGLDFDGASTYELYFGDEKYDPLNLFTETRWNLLPYATRESAKKSNLFWVEPTASKPKVRSSTGVSKTIQYYTDDNSYYNDRHDFTVNLNYSEEAVTSVTITFPKIGIYAFDSMEIICQPMDNYAEQIAALKQDVLENVHIGTDVVTGSITLDSPKILLLSIPCSAGWTAFVDDEEATLYQANIRNMALELDAGEHTIRLEYHTPYLRAGACVSAVGFLGFGLLVMIDRRKKRNIHTDEMPENTGTSE